jgi:hypothetical protein
MNREEFVLKALIAAANDIVADGLSGLSGGLSGTESAGINRHIVGDARALRKRRSDSILASSLACDLARDHSEA